jgi:hypothetical protein
VTAQIPGRVSTTVGPDSPNLSLHRVPFRETETFDQYGFSCPKPLAAKNQNSPNQNDRMRIPVAEDDAAGLQAAASIHSFERQAHPFWSDKTTSVSNNCIPFRLIAKSLDRCVSCRQHPVPPENRIWQAHVTNKSVVFYQPNGWNTRIGWRRGKNASRTGGSLLVWICQMREFRPAGAYAFALPTIC